MAWIIGDSFDFYAAVADMAAGHWDSADATYMQLSTTTRFSVGKSILRNGSSSSSPALVKAIGSNEATIFAALAFQQYSALTGTTACWCLTFRDGTTAQCTVVFESSGNIVLKSGGPTGTVLATYSGAFTTGVWDHFQIKVVINNTTGSIAVRKNGAASDTWSATGLNTRGGTANNYATAVAVFTNSVATNQLIDDLLFYSGSGAAPNDWIGDVRAVQLMPTANTAQNEFTPTGSGATTYNSGSANLGSRGANLVLFTPITAQTTGTVAKIGVAFNAAVTGHAKTALYAADGTDGAPGTLLATSAEVTNPGAGTNDFSFASPPSVTAGTGYYVATMADQSWSQKGPGTYFHWLYTQSQTYASGFPSTAAGTPTNAWPGQQIVTVNPTNCYCVNEAVQDGDTTYVYDATSGHEDLYDLANLATTPTSIIAVQSRMFAKKSDSGTRNGQIRVKSGGTEVGGTDTVLSTTYSWLNKVDTVDPNTSAAWTASAVNALQVGPKVTA